MRIEGFQQSIKHAGTAEKVWLKLALAGREVVPDEAPTITVLSPGGDTLEDAQTMTQDGATAWWYYVIDATSATDYALNLDYQATVNFLVSTIAHEDRFYFDVCKWPIDEPLLTSEVIDRIRPIWAASRPVNWGLDWSEPILDAHLEMIDELRNKKTAKGEFLRPFMIVSRPKLYSAARAYTLAHIAEGIGLPEDEKDRYLDLRNTAIENIGPITIDYDEDLQVDEGESDITLTSVRFRR